MSDQGIGASVRRKEDKRFLVGKGKYVDDIVLPDQLYAFIVRSPYAHAKVGKINTKAALDAPGVVAVFTGADVEADKLGGLPCGWAILNKDGSPAIEPPHPALVTDRVRHVGDPVAMIVAQTRAQAKEAAETMRGGKP